MDKIDFSRSIGLMTLLCTLATLVGVATGQGIYNAYPSGRCAPCADGICRTRSSTFGYTEQQWSRWPDNVSGSDAGLLDNNRRPVNLPTHLSPRPTDEIMSSPRSPFRRRPVYDPNTLERLDPSTEVGAPPINLEPALPSVPSRPREDLILPALDDQGNNRTNSAAQMSAYSQDRSGELLTNMQESSIIYEISDQIRPAEVELNPPYPVSVNNSANSVERIDLSRAGRRNPLR